MPQPLCIILYSEQYHCRELCQAIAAWLPSQETAYIVPAGTHMALLSWPLQQQTIDDAVVWLAAVLPEINAWLVAGDTAKYSLWRWQDKRLSAYISSHGDPDFINQFLNSLGIITLPLLDPLSWLEESIECDDVPPGLLIIENEPNKPGLAEYFGRSADE
jgi:hypothetical protein